MSVGSRHTRECGLLLVSVTPTELEEALISLSAQLQNEYRLRSAPKNAEFVCYSHQPEV